MSCIVLVRGFFKQSLWSTASPRPNSQIRSSDSHSKPLRPTQIQFQHTSVAAQAHHLAGLSALDLSRYLASSAKRELQGG